MVRMRYANTIEEITRIQRRPLPLLPERLMHDTMVSRPWVNDPIDATVAPMEHHVIAPTLHGDGWSEAKAGSQFVRTKSRTGGITIAPRGFGAHFHCDGRPLAANIFLSQSRLQRCADEIGQGRPPELLMRLNFLEPKLFSILALICNETGSADRKDRLYLEQLLDLLCLQLLRTHAAFPLIERGPRGLTSWQVRRVTRFMQERLEEEIRLQDLADLVGLSRFHFCSAFRRATGHTPHQWLVRLRIGRAKDLLEDRRLSITEVGLAIGYQTPSAFALAFRKATGVTPTCYRRWSLGRRSPDDDRPALEWSGASPTEDYLRTSPPLVV